MYQYFPSCNFTRMYPKASKWIIQYFKNNTDVKVQGCCNKTKYIVEDVALGLCQSCRGHIENKGYTYRSLWEYIDEHEDFPLPDYTGLEVSIQHCYRDKEHVKTHEAIRHILDKMHIVYHEYDIPDYCGNFHIETKVPNLQEQLNALPNHSWATIPDDLKRSLFLEQASYHQGHLIITYCNRCTMGFNFVNVPAKHLLQLIYEGNTKDA